MPQSSSSHSTIPGPETINQFQLTNGVKLLVYENRNAQSIYMIGILGGGGVRDPEAKTGLAHFTASLLSRGTKSIPFHSFHNLLESAGANLVFSCGSRHAWFRGKALAEDADLLFRLAADGLQNPDFREEYIGRLRGQLLTGLALRDQDTSEVAALLFDRHLFKGHPLSNPVDGYPETIASIAKSDIENFHETFYSPDDLTIVIAGNIQGETMFALASQYFENWQRSKSKPKNEQPLPTSPGKIIRKHQFLDGKSQVDLILGCIGPSRTSTDYLPAFIGNNILGQFGLMGRIGKRVRVESGLAYYASSSVSCWSDIGTWDISAGVNPQNTEKAIALIQKEIGTFINEQVSDSELENSKSHLIGRMPMSLETNAGLANAILTMQRFNLGLDYYRKYQDLISNVTREQILTVGQKYLHPERLVITSAGPGEDIN